MEETFMNFSSFRSIFNSVWNINYEDQQKTSGVLYMLCWGLAIGLATGLVIGFFRITTDKAYRFVLQWTAHNDSIPVNIALLFLFAVAAGLATGFLVRNPAIRFGGEPWIRKALAEGQHDPWWKILAPKFIGSWLVMACGISVGREGPCIQMGAATAMGLKTFDSRDIMQRRFFILGGCSAGLAAAFSAPFTGICYVFEIMKEKLDSVLLTFLLGGSFGVYLSVTLFWGLDIMLPLPGAALPSTEKFALLIPLGIFAGLVGVAYNYLLRAAVSLYSLQKILSPCFRPLAAFLGAALMIMIFPAITGEGLAIFDSIRAGHPFLVFFCFFLAAKLIFTAFCYGSGIPAGLMVPVLCLGGVAGGICASILQGIGWLGPDMLDSFIVMGMAASFAGAERAPLTGLVLVLEMTGAWATAPGMLLVAAIGSLCGRIAKVRSV